MWLQIDRKSVARFKKNLQYGFHRFYDFTSLDRCSSSINSNLLYGNVPCFNHTVNNSLALSLRAPILDVKIRTIARSIKEGWQDGK